MTSLGLPRARPIYGGPTWEQHHLWGCPELSSIKDEGLCALGSNVGLPWIGLVPARPTDVQSDWDLRILEAG